MADPLGWVQDLCLAPADAVRWACVLEATAPKAGNVYPGREFADLSYADFVTAAEITAQELGKTQLPISSRMLHAVQKTKSVAGTNVNLGMVLLLGPLVAADEWFMDPRESIRSGDAWIAALHRVLHGLHEDDGRNLYAAIQAAEAGGLGSVELMDISTTGPIDIVAAMELAADRDRVARQYANDFADMMGTVVPVVRESIAQSGDLLCGISRAHLRLLAMEPDTLIARKNGVAIAKDVQRRAGAVDLTDPASMKRFDDSLRSPDHKLNPGTTADLIAAALYVLLRTKT